MKAHFQNKANSSVFMWLNNLLAQNGSGFNNVGVRLYPTTSEYNNLYSYAAPYSQFISDSSISGAFVPSGVYVNSNYVNTGQSGLFGINYERGRVYFSQPLPENTSVTGLFSIKDFNIVLTDRPETNILFETQLKLRPKTISPQTGLGYSDLAYPVIFIKNNGYINKPFCFGGQDVTQIDYSLMIFADSKFVLDAVEGLICDSARNYIPLLNVEDMPYDAYGRIKSGIYNYNTIKTSKTPGSSQSIFIENVEKPDFHQIVYNELKNANPDAYFTLLRLTANTYRRTRS